MNKRILTSGVAALQRVSRLRVSQSRELRQRMTPAECALWELLRKKQCVGLRFRRQQVIDGFITDFYCESLRLAVEVDGPYHARYSQRKRDQHREQVFQLRGIRTLRVRNEEVLTDPEGVLNRIRQLIPAVMQDLSSDK